MRNTVAILPRRVWLLVGVTFAVQATVLMYGEYLRHRPQRVVGSSASLATPTESIAVAPIDAAPSNAASEIRTQDTAPAQELASVAPAEKPAPRVADETPPSPVTEYQFTKYKIEAGDSLTRIWSKHNAPYIGAINAAKAFKEVGVPLSAMKGGETVELAIADGDIIALRKRLSGGRILLLEGASKDGYRASVTDPVVTEQSRVATGIVHSSFIQSAVDNLVPYEVADQLVDLFGGRVDFARDLQPGDEFTVQFTERVLEDGSSLENPIVTAASLTNRGKMLAIVRYVSSDGVARFYTEDGNPVGRQFLRYPVQFSRISSVFSDARLHPVLGKRRPHNGVDFAAPTGTPVRTVADGVVERAGYAGGSGRMVVIRHCDRYSTAYLHLSKISADLRPGARVTRGQVIGNVGQTGLATGPHLHFSLYDRGRYVDPLKVVPAFAVDKIEPIAPAVLHASLRTLEMYHQSIMVASAIRNYFDEPKA